MVTVLSDTECATGWVLKPEGMCRVELCVPLAHTMKQGDLIDVAAVWGHLGNPVARDRTGETRVLGRSMYSMPASW